MGGKKKKESGSIEGTAKTKQQKKGNKKMRTVWVFSCNDGGFMI